MALHPVEQARRLLNQADRAASAAGAPACEVLVGLGRRALAEGSTDGAIQAAFVAGRAFACAARAGRGSFSGHRCRR